MPIKLYMAVRYKFLLIKDFTSLENPIAFSIYIMLPLGKTTSAESKPEPIAPFISIRTSGLTPTSDIL